MKASVAIHHASNGASFLRMVKTATDDTLRQGAQIMASNIRARLAPHNKTMQTASGITAGKREAEGWAVEMAFPAFQESFGHKTRGKRTMVNATDKHGRKFSRKIVKRGTGTGFVKPIGGDPKGGFIYSGVEDSSDQIVDLFVQNMPGKRENIKP